VRVDKKTVARWVNCYKASNGVEPVPRSERPPVFDHKAAAREVELLLSKEHGTAARAARALWKEGGVAKLVHPSNIIGTQRQRSAGGAANLLLTGQPLRSSSPLPQRKSARVFPGRV
jgi:hypothetical protein